jgi:aldehyde:ferredoxin oxidoreductase
MNGYTGKILSINLSYRAVTVIDTKDYEEFGGGHGIGSALFFDLVKNKSISGFDPSNVVTIMTSPLTGTMAPGGACARTEVQGIGVQSYPIEWFTRSGFGGRFGAMLKYAGWDGIVIEGKADKPVWVDIRDNRVEIKDAKTLWGLDTWNTQEAICQEISGGSGYGDWVKVNSEGARSTQRPAILTIGPAGENLCRVASLIHDAGNGAGQGGFGGVWGSKNLKAISVIGTGKVSVADPNALMEGCLWAFKNYKFKPEDANKSTNLMFNLNPSTFRAFPMPMVMWLRESHGRPQACIGCQAGCRSRFASGLANEASCQEATFYRFWKLRQYLAAVVNAVASARKKADKNAEGLDRLYDRLNPFAEQTAAELCNRYGINAFEFYTGLVYLKDLYEMGVLGRGKQIDTDLSMKRLGTAEFIEELFEKVAFREKGIGDDLAEGFARASVRWGRFEEDLKTGLLQNPHWGLPVHLDPRVQLDWGYGAILGDRDINEHDFGPLYGIPNMTMAMGGDPPMPAEEFVKIYSDKMIPYENDPAMFDWTTENMYSESVAKLVAWQRHYSRFWKQSVLFCDFSFPDIMNFSTPDKRGMTGEGEPKFFNAVTGKKITFAEGMEMGRKNWNLDNAIWTLQGRHRDLVHFAEYIYSVPVPKATSWWMPGRENGQWTYVQIGERFIDRVKFEDWKTKYYKLEGWDPETGWPTRSTLDILGLAHVADELEHKG